ncbi:MAG: hypothetical protein ACPLW9_00665 [Minisyncoccales bacterium]
MEQKTESQKIKIRISPVMNYELEVFLKISAINGFPNELAGKPLIINGILCQPWNQFLPPEFNPKEAVSISLPEEIWQEFQELFRINNILYKAIERVERRREPESVITLEELSELEDPEVVLELKRELEKLKEEKAEFIKKKESAEKKLHEAVEEEIKLQKEISFLKKKLAEAEKKLTEEKQCFSATLDFLKSWRESWQREEVEEIEITLPRSLK